MTVSELRRDPVTGRWVVVGTEAPHPHDFIRRSVRAEPDPDCPLCEGHEHLTPSELWVERRVGGPNGPGWTTRVVPNQTPLVRVEGTLERQGEGLFDKMTGIGAHEVVIESPRHDQSLADLGDEDIARVLWALRERTQDLRRDTRFRHFVMVKNHGDIAGASLSHPHMHLFALPVVPQEAREEVEGARAHYVAKERCLFCDIIRQEEADGRRVVAHTQSLVALTPFASRSPFETWILPRRHSAHFENSGWDDCLDVGRLLGDMLRRLNQALEHPPYQMAIHSAPVVEGYDFYHWHIEILPRVTRSGALESLAGLHLNPTRPEDAAQFLRDLARK